MNDIDQYRQKITKEEINDLPLKGWEGEIRIITNTKDASQALQDMAGEAVIGFDTESRPAFKKGTYYLPSLVQLADSERVYIFLLSKMKFPKALKSLFEDTEVVKSGVAVRDDVKDLQKISQFRDAGFVDLGTIALDLKLQTHGLRNLAAKFLGIRISKTARCTNWASPNLTKQQISYAATDAWISRELYLAMHECDLIPTNGSGPKK